MIRLAEVPLCSAPEELPDGRDIELALKLERQLQYSLQLLVRVHIREDRIQLFGTVPSWYQKQCVQEIARELAPEYRIQNELRVHSR
jgi:hypothetical protein